jgi:hypothetical protein
MRLLLLLSVSICSLPALDMADMDKRAHALGGMSLAYVSADIADRCGANRWQQAAIGLGSALVAGVAWELIAKGQRDQDDALATALGGAAGVSVRWVIKF